MGLPLRLGLETLGVGGAPPGLGGKFPPLAAAPHVDGIPGPAPPRGPINSGGEGGQPHPEVLAPPSPLLHLSLSQKNGEALLR